MSPSTLSFLLPRTFGPAVMLPSGFSGTFGGATGRWEAGLAMVSSSIAAENDEEAREEGWNRGTILAVDSSTKDRKLASPDVTYVRESISLTFLRNAGRASWQRWRASGRQWDGSGVDNVRTGGTSHRRLLFGCESFGRGG